MPPPDDEALILWLKSFALAHPRWGYKRAHAIANKEGWNANIKRVRRLWRQAGLKVPYRKKRKQLHSHGVAMGVHQPTSVNVCWAMDFQFDQTTDTRPIKLLNVIDEYSRESLCMSASRSMDAKGVLAHLDDLVATRGAPQYLRVDNGPEFIAHALSDFCDELGVTLWFTIPGSPWQNGKVESFNGRLRDEMLNGNLFESVTEAQLLLDLFQGEYNEYRPHSSLGYLSPKEFVALPVVEQRRRLRSAKRRPRSWWELRPKETILA